MDANWKQKSKVQQKVFRKTLEKVDEKRLIRNLPDLHHEAFSKIDCLECANCCKHHSPTFKSSDIKRISKFLGMKEIVFRKTYLHTDEENDEVLNHLPCSFLNSDNTCSIYEVRPSDCARYPYTDEDVFIKRKSLTLANSMVCPAVFTILEKISAKA